MKMQDSAPATTWVWWSVILIGFLLIISNSSPQAPMVSLPDDRELWLSLTQREAGIRWSEILSGLLLIFFGWRSLKPGRLLSGWMVCFVGVWLEMAPLIFWAPQERDYLLCTLLGVLVIALSILIPGMPGMKMFMQEGPEVPPGWSYNPSSWPQRSVMIALAFAGWMVSRYLAYYQLGYAPPPQDPFFGDSTRLVLTSSLSEKWPLSDAGLGAFAYTFEFLMGWMGGPARWRTMPWMVLFFGILIVPLGLVHIFLVISQPVLVGHWCSYCLLAAAIMLPMIPLTLDEVLAMMQFMKQAHKDGKPLWPTFWKGGTVEGGEEKSPGPQAGHLAEEPLSTFLSSFWGMTAPWNLILQALLGIFVMALPGMAYLDGKLGDSLHITGALILVVAVIAMAEVARLLRWLNFVAGLWLLCSVFLWRTEMSSQIFIVVSGLFVLGLSLRRGRIRRAYGEWRHF